MNHWVMAFVGDHARENHEITQRKNIFCVSSNRTQIRKAQPGDRVLFYVAGEGCVARTKVFSFLSIPAAA